MTTKFRNSKVLFLGLMIVLQFLFIGFTPIQGALEIPVTGRNEKVDYSYDLSNNLSALTITRVSVPGRFSYSVQQIGNSVPNQANVVGQYDFAKQNGNIGLIAHNYLAGSSFGWINYGDEVRVTTSSGSVEYYVVFNIMKFKATDPNNFSQPFIDQSTGQTISTREVFAKAYKSGMVTFQTCIAAGGSSTWGIIIIQAVPGRGNVYTAPVPAVTAEDTTPVQVEEIGTIESEIIENLDIKSTKNNFWKEFPLKTSNFKLNIF